MNVSTVYAFYTFYKPESPLCLLYTAVGVHQLFEVKGKRTQPGFYSSHRIQLPLQGAIPVLPPVRRLGH